MPTASPEDIEFQAALGHVSMTWAALEFSLCLIMAVLIETDDYTGLAVGSALDYPRKRDVINSLAELKLSHPDAKQVLAAFMSKVRGLSKERNRVIHATWGTDPNKGGPVRIRFANRGSFEIEMQRHNTQRIRKLASDLGALANLGPRVSLAIEQDVKTWRQRAALPVAPHRAAENNGPATTPDKP